VKSVERRWGDDDFEIVEPGEVTGFNVKNVSVRDIRCGYVGGDVRDHPFMRVLSFRAMIVVFDAHPNRIMRGYTPQIACHTASFPCRFHNLLRRFHPRNAQIVEESPRFLRPGHVALVEMVPARPVCVEAFAQFPALGRFTVLDRKKCVAIGVIYHTWCHPYQRNHGIPDGNDVVQQCGGRLDGQQVSKTAMQIEHNKVLLSLLQQVTPLYPVLSSIVMEFAQFETVLEAISALFGVNM